MTAVADQVAACALHHYYSKLPAHKGKPKPQQEWTVYAAIVAHRRCCRRRRLRKVDNTHQDDDDENNDLFWVVSAATGTKCTTGHRSCGGGGGGGDKDGTSQSNGCIVHDSHAEVLARRGLLRVLWSEVVDNKSKNNNKKAKQQQQSNGSNDSNGLVDSQHSTTLLVETNATAAVTTTNKKDKNVKYQLDPNIELHLYVSDSPCGDASIYPVGTGASHRSNDNNDDNSRNATQLLYTGAKVVVSKTTGVDLQDCGGKHQLLSSLREDNHACSSSSSVSTQHVARETHQMLGKLRTKAGRSNLPDHLRSFSMSCSDKLVLWSVLGLQGALLAAHLDPPVISLSSVVVSRDVRLLGGNSTTVKGEDNDNGPQYQALARAIPRRVDKVWEVLRTNEKNETMPLLPKTWQPITPTVHIVECGFEAGKAAMAAYATSCETNVGSKRKREDGTDVGAESNKQRKKVSQPSPCGISLNWNQIDGANNGDDGLELLVGARGIQQGKKPKSAQDYVKLASRLSRARLVQEFVSHNMTSNVVAQKGSSFGTSDNATTMTTSYQQYKATTVAAHCPEWTKIKSTILSLPESPLAGWICTSKDDDFDMRQD